MPKALRVAIKNPQKRENSLYFYVFMYGAYDYHVDAQFGGAIGLRLRAASIAETSVVSFTPSKNFSPDAARAADESVTL